MDQNAGLCQKQTDAQDQWCLRRILDIRWCQHVSNREEQQITSHLDYSEKVSDAVRPLGKNDESADARRILTTVPQSDWKRLAGRPHTSLLATMKNDLVVEDATEQALDRPLWGLLAASGAMH